MPYWIVVAAIFFAYISLLTFDLPQTQPWRKAVFQDCSFFLLPTKVCGSLKRLKRGETFLWQGKVEQAIALFKQECPNRARKFLANDRKTSSSST